MATIQRPTKEGNATTYQGKVAAGYSGILAPEVDADLDLLYSAWNSGVDTVNIKDGSVTTPKLASGAVSGGNIGIGAIQTANLADASVTTPKIADGAVTLGKLASAVTTAGGDLSGQYPNPAVARIASGILPFVSRGLFQATATTFDMWGNSSGSLNYDASKPQWLSRLDYTNDYYQLYRAPAGTSNLTQIFSVDSSGKISGGAATGARQHFSPTALTITTYDVVVLCYTLPAITTRGGAVHLHFLHSFYYTSSSTSGNVMVTTAI